MRNIPFLLSWYFAIIFTLLFSLFLLVNISVVRNTTTPIQIHYQAYKALPTTLVENSVQDINIDKADGRELLISNLFRENKSPLEGEAHTFVEVADRYSLDYKLMPAIAMQESNGGKILPLNSFNPFGYGIYGGKVMRFNSFEEAIDRVGRGIRENYLDLGLTTPDQIMVKYTPPSLQKGGSWAIGVSAFMEQLR